MEDTGMGIAVIALGAFLSIVGIGLPVIILLERRWWERTITPILGMELPDLGLGGMAPVFQQVIQGLFKRILLDVKVLTLLAGALLLGVGPLLIFLGVEIWI